MTDPILNQALKLLGPLEGRIMREAWAKHVPARFVVQEMRERMPHLAYTTVMSTLARLADKGLLRSTATSGQRAYIYEVTESPAAFINRMGDEQVAATIRRFGDVALAAFNRHVEQLSPAQRERLRRISKP